MSQKLSIYLWIIIASLIFNGNLFGQTTFQKTFGHLNGNQANTVIVTNSGGYAIAGWYDVDGLFTAEFYLIVTDSNADTLWAKTYGEKVDTTVNLLNGSGNEGFNVIQTNDNGFLFVGERHAFAGGQSDVFAVKIDETGGLQWSKTYGGATNDYGFSVQQTVEGDFVIGGFTESYGAGIRDMYLIKTNSFGDTLWTRTYGGPSIEAATDMEKTADGGFVLVGYTFSFGAGNSDVYVIKTDANGDILWQKTYGGALNDIGHAIVETQDGGFVICGETESFGSGDSDVYLIKVDENGTPEWSKVYGGEGFDAGKAVVESEDNGFILSGYTRSFGDGDEDFYLIKTDEQGDTLWTKTYGGMSDEAAQSVKQTPDNGYIAAGYTRSFGAGALDIYLIKMDDLGNSDCHQQPNATIVSNVGTIENTVNSSIAQGAIVAEKTTLVGFTDTRELDPCDFVSTDDFAEKQLFRIYPNPVKDYLIIENSNGPIYQDMEIKIYDLLGRVIQSYSMQSGENKIDVSMIPKGVFLVNIWGDNQQFSYSFVKL